MPLTPALSNALSGLVTAKGAIDSIANNIANVNTVGYTRKIVSVTGVTLGVQGAGVTLANLERLVDVKLQKDILQETGVLNQYDTTNQYYQNIQDLFGRPEDNNSISHLLTSFTETLQTLSNSPTAPAAQYEAAEEAKTLATRFTSMSEQLQFLRVEADRAVEMAVNEVNDHLTNIDNLNNHIQRAWALGQTTADLEDQRDVALTELAKLIDIRIAPQSDATTMVFTANGRPLLDAGGVRPLEHTAASVLSPEMTYDGGLIDGITLVNRDITEEIQSGELKALIDMRDSVLPNLQSELDTLAKQVMDDVNQAHNRGVGFPTLQTNFTGTTNFVDPTNQRMAFGKGDTLIALVGTDGAVDAQITITELMTASGNIDADGGFSIANLAADLQTWLQAQAGTPTATVSLDSYTGKISIDLNTGTTGLVMKDIAGAYSDTFAPAAVTVAAGDTLTLTDADGTTATTLNFAGTETLADVATMINGVAGYTATVVQLSATQSRLVVTNQEPFTFSGTGSVAGKLNLTEGSDLDATILLDDDGDGTLDQFGDTDAAGNTYANNTASGFSNFLGLNDLFVTGRADTVHETPIRTANWTTSGPGTLTFEELATDVTPAVVRAFSVNVSAGDSLQDIADTINAAAGNADASGDPFVKAAVVSEGGGYRLRLIHQNSSELVTTGTAMNNLGLTESAVSTGVNMEVRSDIQSDASLMSRGALRWNGDNLSNQRWELSEGDNRTIRAMVDTMGSSKSFAATGNIGTAQYSVADFAAAMITLNSRGAEVAESRLAYQKPLNEALEYRQKNLSGVNLDEEMASLIIYQQAYSAAARVISVTEKMMDVLENIIR